MKRPNYHKARFLAECNHFDLKTDDGFINTMEELLLAPDTVIPKKFMRRAIDIIKRQRAELSVCAADIEMYGLLKEVKL